MIIYNGEIKKYELMSQSIDNYDRNGNNILDIRNTHDTSKQTKTVKKWDSKGNLLEKVNYGINDSLRYTYKYRYDEKGNLLNESKFNSENVQTDTEEFKYNNEGKIVEHIIYVNQMEFILARHVYEYDEEGNRVESGYNIYGELSSKGFSKYDSWGNVIFQGSYNSEGKLIPRWIRKYNSVGNKIEEIEYWDGLLKGKTLYKYDTIGNRTDVFYYNADGKIKNEYHYIYEYDGKNNWVARFEKLGEHYMSILEREISYY